MGKIDFREYSTEVSDNALGENTGTDSGLRCLECGASLPDDAVCCHLCGNEKLFLPRWTPPEDRHVRAHPPIAFNKDIRILASLSFTLLIALWLLGAARAQTNDRISGVTDPARQILVGAQANTTPDTSDLEIPAIREPDSDIGEIDPIRTAAIEAMNKGAWADSIRLWSDVTASPDATVTDFIALADSYRGSGDEVSMRAVLNRACVRFPDTPEPYIALGAFLEKNGDMEAAKLQYQAGLSHNPGNSALAEGLGRVNTALGNNFDVSGLINGLNPDILSATIEGKSIEPPPSQPERINPPRTSPPPPPPAAEFEYREENTPGRVNLIGGGTVNSLGGDSDDPNGTDIEQDLLENSLSLVGVTDLRASATSDQVVIEMKTDGPVAFSTSNASGPPRLIIRVPQAHFAPGINVPRSVNLNVPLVERVNLVETSADNNYVILLVIFLGDDVRYSVAADAHTLKVTINRVPVEEAG